MSPHEQQDLLSCALVLAQTVPETVLLDAAAAIECEGQSIAPSTRAAVTLGVAHPEYRAAIARFIAGWSAWDATVSPAAVAWTLRARAVEGAAGEHRAQAAQGRRQARVRRLVDLRDAGGRSGEHLVLPRRAGCV